MRLVLFLLVFLTSAVSFGQDTTFVLSFEQYMEQVMTHHPDVYRAEIVAQSGEAGVRQARGGFDPKLYGDASQKYYKGDQYYSVLSGGMKVPTWFGITAQAGYDNNDGVYLNPQYRVPDAGLWSAGLQIELGNGLIIDERRAALKRAKINQTASENQRLIDRNMLRFNAAKAYWDWFAKYQEVLLYQGAVRNAEERFQAIVMSAELGDKPFIDTVEAKTVVESRRLSLIEATNAFQNSEIKAEYYLWSKGFVPIELENTIPLRDLDISDVGELLLGPDTLFTSHPILQQLDLSIQDKNIQLRLKKEQFKPNLSLKYNAISEPVGNNPFSSLSLSNYTWGATFAYPILARKARGGVQLAKLKLEDQRMKQKTQQQKILNAVAMARNDYLNADQMVTTATSLSQNYQTMFDAENRLFNLGESSVFMINSRENKWLNAQVKQIKAEKNLRISYHQLKLTTMTGDE